MLKINGLKKTIKQIISKNAFLCMLISRLMSFCCGLIALRYKFFGNYCSYIDSSTKVTGWNNISIGKNSVIGASSWLNVNDRSSCSKSLIIGENCFIGKSNFITVGKSVVFGDYCLTAANCSFIGSSHNIDDPLKPYITTGVDAADSITIGTNCFFGYGVMVLGSINIGHGSIIGAGSVVLKDIPPFSVVVGNPARIVKRYSFSERKWIRIDHYIEEDIISEDEYRQGLRNDVGFYPHPISAASSTLGDV
jgi:acetyltransferase-like isoleucine patch superfamily enzyme